MTLCPSALVKRYNISQQKELELQLAVQQDILQRYVMAIAVNLYMHTSHECLLRELSTRTIHNIACMWLAGRVHAEAMLSTTKQLSLDTLRHTAGYLYIIVNMLLSIC